MRVIRLMIVMLVIPAIAYAHSGTLVRTLANYVPIALAFIPFLINPILKLFKKINSFFKSRQD
ncbi:MAG: hypothetical protein H6Q69_3361 [Firmicutes bacterium]|nr:hypothetical protein [Bacillota bacterium]